MDLNLFSHFEEGPGTAAKHTTRKRNVTASSSSSSSSKREKLEESSAGIDTNVDTSIGIRPTVTYSAIPSDYQNHIAVKEKVKNTSSREPAKVYPFKLDSFQQEAVNYIDNDESVLVAAHTSAGKTAVAEYAIAKSLKNGQRVIYTSPIKALSNQKYRDLQEEFGDVGLMTGDMTINPNAACLIMTTEILRSMLYRGSEVMREIAWVIYDEVHYMRDKERGVVWEESIILLPHKVKFVFLSATIPNAKDFVSWVSKIHHQPCHVVYTDYRPVPLQHYVYPTGAEGLYLVVDEKGKFREDNFQKAMSLFGDSQQSAEGGSSEDKKWKGKKGAKNVNNDLFKIIKLIMDRQLDPCIIFSFSKKECESYALQTARLDFNSPEEKVLVEQVFINAMDSLSDDDKALPAVQTILPLLKNGVGIHHGGLLPILKEVIEILFQEGLIKCLFATETFSIGINMPAKTVVFTSTRKFDGQDFRWITSGEYIQMSGRAGRRGKDDKGIVIQMLDENMEPDIAKNMIYGASDPLFSSYHVGYNMVLNMLRVEDANPENLIRSSFHQFQQERDAPELERQAVELRKEASSVVIEHGDAVQEYDKLSKLLSVKKKEINSIIMRPEFCLPFLHGGRLIRVNCDDIDWGWGVLVNVSKLNSSSSGKNHKAKVIDTNLIRSKDDDKELEYVADVLLEVWLSSNADGQILPSIKPKPSRNDATDKDGRSELVVVHVAFDSIIAMSTIRLRIPKNLTSDTQKQEVLSNISEVCRRFEPPTGEGIPLLDIDADFSIPSNLVANLLPVRDDLEIRISKNILHNLPSKERLLELYNLKMKLIKESDNCMHKAKDSQAVAMKEQLKKMKRVLRKLDFINAENVLAPKGRFSCELTTADELVLTNMVFDGVFNELTVPQTVALLSCFVHKEESKNNNNNNMRSDMQAPFRQLQSVARNVAKICFDVRLITDEDEYVSAFSPGLVDVTYAWCTGAKFADICKLTDAFEGNIIRVLRRLEELLRQLASASLAIGNAELKDMFEQGSMKIRRGVVFAASLYL